MGSFEIKVKIKNVQYVHISKFIKLQIVCNVEDSFICMFHHPVGGDISQIVYAATIHEAKQNCWHYCKFSVTGNIQC